MFSDIAASRDEARPLCSPTRRLPNSHFASPFGLHSGHLDDLGQADFDFDFDFECYSYFYDYCYCYYCYHGILGKDRQDRRPARLQAQQVQLQVRFDLPSPKQLYVSSLE